jgi:hypothetical protein
MSDVDKHLTRAEQAAQEREARDLQYALMVEALVAEDGNITRAAKRMDPPISRQRATAVVRAAGLRDFARELRLRAGAASPTGRPKEK